MHKKSIISEIAFSKLPSREYSFLEILGNRLSFIRSVGEFADTIGIKWAKQEKSYDVKVFWVE